MNRQYHPQELIWRPRGETGLSRDLAARLQRERPTAWVGHGSARVARLRDATGSDTRDGFAAALVVNGRESHWSREGHPDLALQRSLLMGLDLAVVEGLVDSDAPWIVELDADGGGLEDIPESSLAQVVALVGLRGPTTALPPGGIARFAPSEADDLADHLMDVLEGQARARRVHGLLWTTPDDSAEDRASAVRALGAFCDEIHVAAPDASLERVGIVPLLSRHPGWGQAGSLLTLQEDFEEATIVTLDASVAQAARAEALWERRDPLAETTAFRARDTHMASPSCAIWEPRSKARLFSMLSLGVSCLRRTLVAANTTLLESA